MPRAEDTLLVIEVADSSLEDDRSRKIPLYARHGIPTVWLLNLRDEVIEVFSGLEDGEYLQSTSVGADETLGGVPGLAVTAEDVFG